MTFRPVKTKDYIKFLEAHGCKGVKKKNGGSHFKYKKPGMKMSIPVWAKKKSIPPFHVHQGCKTLGVEMQYCYDWISENC